MKLATQTLSTSELGIAARIAAQAARTPAAPAVTHHDHTLTYAALNRRANQLAHYLQGLGVGPEVRVGLCLPRSVDFVVSALGVLKAGGAYVPLDPAYPPERLAYMLADAQAPVLLTHAALLPGLPDTNIPTLCLDRDWPTIAAQSTDEINHPVALGNLAYMIYTSGSTGRPKGVAVPHRGLANLIGWTHETFAVTAQDRATLVAGVGFDAAVWEIWSYLTIGASLAIPDDATRGSAVHLRDWLVAQQITVGFLPTPLAQLVLTLDWPADVPLRFLQTGGDRLQQAPPPGLPFTLINNYGPTEDSVIATSGPVSPTLPPGTAPDIGRPIANTEAILLDAQWRPVASGAVGELYLGGAGLARGYHNQPALTAERFVPHPCSPVPGARVYRTGDLARYRADGTLEFLGRIDSQVKVRGFRIELGEIEAVLYQHPAVQAAVVVAREERRPQGAGETRLVAYIVAGPGTPPTGEELRRFLLAQLPDYMVPAAFVPLAALPLTPNGKVDRGAALPAPALDQAGETTAFVPPRTAVEEVLAGLWAGLLGIGRVGAQDNFFALGGHSLLAMQLAARIRETFQVDLALQAVFAAPTLAEQAAVIEQAGQGTAPILPLRPARRAGALPLSFGQEQVWFLQQLDPTNNAYHFQGTLRFRGPLQLDALAHSLDALVARHEIFRTSFPAVDRLPVQVVHAMAPAAFRLLDLTAVPAAEREAAAQAAIAAEVRRPFALDRLPLIRWTLLRLGPEDHILLQVEHHLLHDGWSFNLLCRELQELYTACATGREAALRPPAVQYADFAVWQRAWVESAHAAGQTDYWRARLVGVGGLLELPLDRPRPPTQTFRGANRRVDLPPALADALRDLSRGEGATLYMTMMAAFLTLLHRYTGQEDLCVGTALGNRRWRESEDTIGMFVNTVALRADLGGNPSFRELLRRVRAATLEAYEHQDLPFSKVVEAVQPERSAGYAPLYQALFSFHDSQAADLDFLGTPVEILEGISNGSAKMDLNVTMIPRAEQKVGTAAAQRPAAITMIWEYNSDLFDPATVQRMMDHYQTLLHGIISAPDQAIAALPVLAEAEQDAMRAWNATQRPYPPGQTLPTLFAARAAQTPGKIAVSAASGDLTYGELDRQANQLAHYLQSLGVGPEAPVGLFLERSPALIVGALAILKAGGAYVPFDPAYPASRLAFMLREARMPVLLTQQSLTDRLPEYAGRVLALDAPQPPWAGAPTTPPPRAIDPANLAYVIYTSGSTGHPKGIAVTHAALANLIQWHQEQFAMTPAARATHLAGLSFDAAVWELWSALGSGATLVLVPDALRLDIVRLRDWLARQGITHSFLPTPLAEQLLQLDGPAPAALRWLYTGGDRLHRRPSATASYRLVNNYGPAECTVVATSSPVLPDDPGLPAIGGPIANTTIYLLDAQGRLAPAGVPGEVYIGGAGVARGYLGRPDLTAERFVPDPFSATPGARLYRTGDLARRRADGTLEFLGRRDFQVKIRGFRIELGEIESVLQGHPAVREAVVLAREDQPGEPRLVAYVVPQGSGAELVTTLRRHLQERLPDYMVPAAWLLLDRLPLSANGKADRQALPAPRPEDSGADPTAAAFVAPGSPVEEALAEILAEILQLPRLSVQDNFFHLGGHSLLATRAVWRIQEQLGVPLPLRSLFEHPTVAALAPPVEALLLAAIDEELAGLGEEELAALAQAA